MTEVFSAPPLESLTGSNLGQLKCPKNQEILTALYPNVGAQLYTNPDYAEVFSFMTDEQAVELAQNVLREIEKSGLKRIVVLESGAAPLAEICIQLCRASSKDLEWSFLKIPRDLKESLGPMLQYYLSSKECSETVLREELDKIREMNLYVSGQNRLEALMSLVEQLPEELTRPGGTLTEKLARLGYGEVSRWRDAFSLLLRDTQLGRRFSEPFLLFDEYITSGTVISNTQAFFNLISPRLSYKVGCYLINIDNPENFGSIAFALYDAGNRLRGFRDGAYPFENRLDLAGFFYITTGSIFSKVTLEELSAEAVEAPHSLELLTRLYTRIEENGLLAEARELCRIEQVSSGLSEDDLVRFGLWRLEALSNESDPRFSEFLRQLFEMYGPPWFPLPIAFHKDFTATFDALTPHFDKLLGVDLIIKYSEERTAIVSEIASLCLARRRAWQKRISLLIKEKNYVESNDA